MNLARLHFRANKYGILFSVGGAERNSKSEK